MMGDGSTQMFQVPREARGERLDRWLAEQLPGMSRAQIQKLIEQGAVTVNGKPPGKAGAKLAGGEPVAVVLPPAQDDLPRPEAIPLEVVFENRNALVINKPAGMVIHPAPGHQGGTLVNALLARYPKLDDPEQRARPGIVHRLDRETSGLLVIAKSAKAREYLQQQFRRRSVRKEYLALVQGRPSSAQGVIEGPIGRDPRNRQKRAVVASGRPAESRYTIVEEFRGFTLLNVQPLTGRTHQIRVHLAAIGHPVIGDKLYGPRKQRLALNRHFLHAWRLTIKLPGLPEARTFEAPLPAELEAVLAALREQS
jgi:23S rRNA pseudouridine1911/1915/1917 synthase